MLYTYIPDGAKAEARTGPNLETAPALPEQVPAHVPYQRDLDVVTTKTSALSSQVLQSAGALVRPVRLRRLSIQPVSLLVSIHASLKLYIASDHTPLSFSLFERGPVCTTARQLVHALAMHYAAGALFRAGTCRAAGSTHLFSLSEAFRPAWRIDTRPASCSEVEISVVHIFLIHYIIYYINIHYKEGDLQSRRLPFVCNQAGMCAQVRNVFSLSPVLRFGMITPLGSCSFVPQRGVKLCSCEKQNLKTHFVRFLVIFHSLIRRLERQRERWRLPACLRPTGPGRAFVLLPRPVTKPPHMF